MYKLDYKTYCNIDTLNNIKIIDRYITKDMSLRKYNDVVIVPTCKDRIDQGEMYDLSGSIVNDVNSNINYENRLDIKLEQQSKLNCYEKPILYLGAIPNCWGHFITDGLSKMWFLLSSHYQTLKDGCEVFVVIPYYDKEEIPRPLQNIINLLLGYNIQIKNITESRIYKEVYIPENSLFIKNGCRRYTKLYYDTVNQLISRVDIRKYKTYDKIYLSRSNWVHVNPDFGETDIEKSFNKVGYNSISPEKYSINEQIALFYNAKSIVSTSGSLAHNSLFCKEGTEIIVLRKCSSDSLDYQQMIDQMKNHNVTYIDCNLTLFVDQNVGLGPFFLYINDKLVSFFKDKYSFNIKGNFNSKRYMEYVKLCFKRGNIFYRTPQYNDLSDYSYIKLTSELREERNMFFYLKKYVLPNNIICHLKKYYCKIKR